MIVEPSPLPYFDVMPVHEPPRHLESITSYLARLGESNGLRSLDELSALCFPQQNRRIVRRLADYPPGSFTTLANAAATTESVLQSTTFHCLAKKFGRSTHPQALSRFLQGSVAASLRYCPTCVGEHGYYSLGWRFLCLHGCPKHHCLLLDHCGHCGNTIPFIQAPFRVGVCPSCGQELSSCLTETMDRCEQPLASARERDLEYLLLPASWEGAGDNTASLLGRQLAYWRGRKLFSAAHVANFTGQTVRVIYAMERGTIVRFGAKFDAYLGYAECLGITMQELFSTKVPDEIVQQNPRAQRNCAFLQEESLVNQAHQVRDDLERSGKRVTKLAIAKAMGMSVGGLEKYPGVRSILEEVSAQNQPHRRRYAREAELVSRVNAAIAILQSSGQVVSQTALGKAVGISIASLKRYPEVAQILRRVSQNYHYYHSEARSQREEKLLAQTEAAIQSLLSLGKPVTQKAVGEIVGMAPSGLRKYSRVRAVLAGVEKKRHEQHLVR